MTPKEKAKELIKKMHIENDLIYVMSKVQAKKCALIAVDELIDNCDNSIVNEFIRRGAISYWNEVKQEIKKL